MLVIMKRSRLLLLTSVMLLFWTTDILKATPIIEINKTAKSIEKGKSFQIRLKILANECLTDIYIIPIPPEGFVVFPIPQPIIKVKKQINQIRTTRNEYVYINKLEPGSCITVAFKVITPPLIEKPFKGISTRELKVFDFNISYKHLINANEISGVQTISAIVRYTTSIYTYLIFGCIGIFLGHIIKVLTDRHEELKSHLKNKPKKIRTLFQYVFITNAVSLLTLLVIGLSVLLVLSKEQLPTRGWYDSLVLGTGLAILGDHNLLLRLRNSLKTQK